MTGKEAKEKLKKQYERSNNFVRNNYDRISITVPKGMKDTIKELLPGNQSINSLVNELLVNWIEERNTD